MDTRNGSRLQVSYLAGIKPGPPANILSAALTNSARINPGEESEPLRRGDFGG